MGYKVHQYCKHECPAYFTRGGGCHGSQITRLPRGETDILLRIAHGHTRYPCNKVHEALGINIDDEKNEDIEYDNSFKARHKEFRRSGGKIIQISGFPSEDPYDDGIRYIYKQNGKRVNPFVRDDIPPLELRKRKKLRIKSKRKPCRCKKSTKRK